MTPRTTASIPVASRISGFVYAIRNIVAEARKVEAAGRKVRYLNIGDPITFGFKTPPHLVEAVERAMRDGHNGYAPSVGIAPAREAVAAECQRRGMPLDPDRVVITSGTSEGIELALTALAGPGDEVLVPVPTYPLYTAVLAKIGARPVFYGTTPDNAWLPDVRRNSSGSSARPRARSSSSIRTIRRAHLSGRRAARAARDRRRAQHPAARRRGLRRPGVRRPGRRDRELNPDAPVITFSSLSKAYLAPGWRSGWLAVGRTERLDDVLGAIKKLADGRLCSTAPMEYAIVAALNGDRSHQQAFRDALRERADLTVRAAERDRRHLGRGARRRRSTRCRKWRCRRA